ncbi:hypothetical protein OG352_35115 [Streptomyces sp. NBC_01485]|uniref:hypothetical protein n=1 Tax=Streptomyces sp. NBC_01485 TaxID=2903884 RepID=UPI002E3451A9|nr:hypothetical protein [Streptomyces sp. NBC_01485]
MLAAALAAGTLFATAACSDGDGDSASTGSGVAAKPVAERTTASPTKPVAKPLTPAGARTALITEGDLEDDWTQVKSAASWQDKLLIGKVDASQFLTAKTQAPADCQRLLDGLYDDDLLGRPSGASALTGFTEGNSRLLYQVGAYQRAALGKSLDWLESLPTTCDQFNAVAPDGSTRSVQVIEASLPKAGDTRQGVTVTVQGASGGSPVTLTLDVAAVRVGDDAITVTNGGLDGADHDSTEDAVSHGTTRLKDVREGRTPAPEPSEFD